MGRKYLPFFEHGGFLTRAFNDKSLVFYPNLVWEDILDVLLGNGALDRDREEVMFYLALGAEVKLDGQNRLSIPLELRTRMGIEKEIVLVALGEKLEIWDFKRWEEYSDSLSGKVVGGKLTTIIEEDKALKEARK